MSSHTNTSNKSVPDVTTLFPWNEEALQVAERNYRSFLQGAQTLQGHAVEYWNGELRKAVDAMNEMAQCETAVEALGVQSRYTSEAMQGLIAESQKVMEQLAAFTATPLAMVLNVAGQPAPTEAGHGGNGVTTRRSSPRRSSPSGR